MASSRGHWRLVYTRRAAKDVEKLDPVTRRRLGRKLSELAVGEKPLERAKPLVDPKLGSHRFRIGDYRVVFDVQGHDLVVLRIAHRRDVYRR